VNHATNFFQNEQVRDVTGSNFDEGNAELIQEIGRNLKKYNIILGLRFGQGFKETLPHPLVACVFLTTFWKD
jgi:hypothetical protein